MKNIVFALITSAAIAAMPLAGSALTFKKGQVLGADGQIYDGASSPRHSLAHLAGFLSRPFRHNG